MIKIEVNTKEDEVCEINVNAEDSSPAEFFYVIDRCFTLVAEKTNTDRKKVEKYYKEFKKYI